MKFLKEGQKYFQFKTYPQKCQYPKNPKGVVLLVWESYNKLSKAKNLFFLKV